MDCCRTLGKVMHNCEAQPISLSLMRGAQCCGWSNQKGCEKTVRCVCALCAAWIDWRMHPCMSRLRKSGWNWFFDAGASEPQARRPRLAARPILPLPRCDELGTCPFVLRSGCGASGSRPSLLLPQQPCSSERVNFPLSLLTTWAATHTPPSAFPFPIALRSTHGLVSIAVRPPPHCDSAAVVQ